MTFAEKLVLIMNITDTSNKTLAKHLNLDPSRISQLRTGIRKKPKNSETIDRMASYFAKQCKLESRRLALSEALGRTNIKYAKREEQLTTILQHWLIGESYDTIEILDRFSEPIPPQEDYPGTYVSSHYTKDFYGNEGKRTAFLMAYNHLITLEKPTTIYLISDGKDDWYAEDASYADKMYSLRNELIHRGFHFVQIIRQTTFSTSLYDLMLRWIGSYQTGNVHPYYYPRLRDNTFCHSMLVCPGEVSVFSTSFLNQSQNHYTTLSTIPETTQALHSIFRDYYEMCKPALAMHVMQERMHHCLINFALSEANRLQKNRSLSIESMPVRELIPHFFKIDPELGNVVSELFKSMYSVIDADIAYSYESLDLCPLPTASQVCNGEVPIYLPGVHTENTLYYTPETFVLHLRNILRLLDERPNYHFIPIPFKKEQNEILMIKENCKALLVREAGDPALFEIDHPTLVYTLQEYLRRTAEEVQYLGSHRKRIQHKIRELIHQIESNQTQ